ncbi:Hypothetical protein, putative [Bodo saltans]|uniref:Uncharacterized protein n=1 Tax=Bodo saltans TaxID=75058 RepID=A0A0S4JYI1_BODSA|nr:Hypothetical protein, putative [Bodo saltans]|eukprot:CUG94415.1 Hypothetical protein, putative [Bodo saltans]
MGPGTSRSYFDIEAEKIQVQQRRPLLTIWSPLALHNNIDVGATRELCGMLAHKCDGCLRFSSRNRKVMAHFVPLHYCGEDNLSALDAEGQGSFSRWYILMMVLGA